MTHSKRKGWYLYREGLEKAPGPTRIEGNRLRGIGIKKRGLIHDHPGLGKKSRIPPGGKKD